MRSHVAELSSQKPLSLWLLRLAATLLVLGLGYTISLSPSWLHLGFRLTDPTHLIGLLGMLAVALAILKWPEAGLLGLLAVIYTNASEVGVRFHELPSLLQAFLPVLLIALTVRWLIRRGGRVSFDSVMVWLVAYAALLFASSARARSVPLADASLLEYLKSLVILFLIVNLVTSRLALRRAVWVLVLAGAFLGTISVYQVATSSYDTTFWGFGRIKLAQIVGSLYEPRIAGPLGDPNFYAQILLIVVPLALYRLWDESSVRLKMLAAYALGVITVALVFTYSRGGALALGLVLVLALLDRKAQIRSALLGLLVIVPLLVLAPQQFEGRLGTLKQLLPGQHESVIHADTSIQERTLLMRCAWQMFLDHPILGVGADNYGEYYDEYAERVGSAVSSYEDFGRRRFPHSLYLQIAAETGLVGLVVFAVILALTLRRLRAARRLFRAANDERSRGLVTSLLLGFLGYLTTSLILHGDYVRCFWLLVALAIAASKIAEHAAAQAQAARSLRAI